jgi:hypothetical protein
MFHGLHYFFSFLMTQSVLLPKESNLLWRSFTKHIQSEFLCLSTHSLSSQCLFSLTRVHSRQKEPLIRCDCTFLCRKSYLLLFTLAFGCVPHAFPDDFFKKFTSICPMVDEGQRMFAEGLVSPSFLFPLWLISVLTFISRRRCGSDGYIPPRCA